MQLEMIKETLTDAKHWVGWILSTVGLVLVFHLLGVHALYTPYWHVLVVLFTLVIIDVFKHVIELQ